MPELAAGHLMPHHYKELVEGSGIAPEILDAAGVRTIPGREIHRAIGWAAKDWKFDSPGILFPFRDLTGTEVWCQVKPDFPRANEEGKTIKYESPKGKTARVFFPPGFVPTDPQPLIITEGAKKCLSARSHGFNCIALAGVWQFAMPRLRTDAGRTYGPHELLPDLAALDWSGRDVFIIFDSDAVTKDSVRRAQARLASMLRDEDAEVRVVRLPELDGARQ